MTETLPSSIRHVFVVFLENAELSSVQSKGSYEMGLAKNYTQATHYYAPCHPSAPEYLAVTSGSTWQCGSDATNSDTYTTSNLGHLLQGAGLSWGGYMESMPTPCDTSDSYPYAARHNPFVYYTDTWGSVCKTHDVNFSAWDANVSAGTIPSFAFFAPNLKNDGHDTSVSYADSWLKGWLPKYLSASWFNSSVWFITYDEGSSNSGYGGFGGGHLYFAAVSPFTKGGHSFSTNSTHYNLLSTVEWLLGLGKTGNNDSTASYPAMKGLFNFNGTTPQAQYNVTGRVTTATTGLGVSAATVSVTGGSNTTTNSTGYYRLSLQNGSYTLTASATGRLSRTASVTVNGSAVTKNFALTNASSVKATYRISGAVSYAYNSSLVSGATVGIVGGSSMTTGSNGSYWVYEPNGSYTVQAWAAGTQPATQKVTVSGGAVTSDFSLARFYWEVSGTVTAAVSGGALVGTNVSVVKGPIAFPEWSVANSSGGYAVWLANGTYVLQATALGYVSLNSTVTVNGASVTQGISLSSHPPKSYEISGTVRFGYNNALAAGASVHLVGGTNLTTGTNGTFWFFEPNGTYNLTAWVAGFALISQSVGVRGGSATSNFLLPRFYWAIGGTVVNATSKSKIVGANVSVASGPSGATAWSLTNASGVFSLQLANGTYELVASAAGYTSKNVSVNVTHSVTNLAITLAAASHSSTLYRISGTVRSWYNSSLLTGATVQIPGGLSMKTGTNGTYWFFTTNGTYNLSAWMSGFKPVAHSVTIAGASTTIPFVLPRFYWPVSGTVSASGSGTKLKGATVSVASGPSSYAQSTSTNASGGYILWLANGTYTVKVSASTYVSTTMAVTVAGAPTVANAALKAASVHFGVVGVASGLLIGAATFGRRTRGLRS